MQHQLTVLSLCRSATVDDDEPAAGPVPSAKPVPSASRRVPGEALILADLDVAACAGLLEESDSASLRPAWLDESWAADIRSIQVCRLSALLDVKEQALCCWTREVVPSGRLGLKSAFVDLSPGQLLA